MSDLKSELQRITKELQADMFTIIDLKLKDFERLLEENREICKQVLNNIIASRCEALINKVDIFLKREISTEMLHVYTEQAQTESFEESQEVITAFDDTGQSWNGVCGILPSKTLCEEYLPSSRNQLTQLGPSHEEACKISHILQQSVEEDLSLDEQNQNRNVHSPSSTIYSETSDSDGTLVTYLPPKKTLTIEKKEMEILSSHLEICSKEKQQLENYKKQLSKKNDNLSIKNKHIQNVNKQYSSENRVLKADNASFLETKKQLENDCQNLTRKNDRLLRKNRFCESKNKQVENEKERLLKENKELKKEANNRIEQLQKENRQHLRQSYGLKLKMDKCSKGNQKLLNEIKKHLKEKEQISNDREQIRKEKDKFAMKEQLLQETDLRFGELLLENELQRNENELRLRKIDELNRKCEGFFHQTQQQLRRLQELEPLAVDGCNNLVVELESSCHDVSLQKDRQIAILWKLIKRLFERIDVLTKRQDVPSLLEL